MKTAGIKKTDILFESNYRYNFDRAMYVNRRAKKAFSMEFVDDNPAEEIIKRIEEKAEGDEWRFYFKFPPSDGVRRELERLLG